jgi:hypothetical protein
MRMPFHFKWLLLILLCALALPACDSGEPGKFPLDAYEGPEGEAIVRHVVKTLPPISPEIPKVYTIVKGPHLKSTSMEFARRFQDLKLTFVSGENLTVRGPDKDVIDPRSDTSPVTIQIADIRATGRDKWEVLAGWAWKKTYERNRYTLKKTESGAYEMKLEARMEGNYVKPD